jgi:predicted GNAT family acetyltransferase
MALDGPTQDERGGGLGKDDVDALVVVNDEKAQQFQIRAEGQLASIQYAYSNGSIVFVHTEVPPALEGRGIAGKLARAALEFARERKRSVIPRCPFVAAYIRKHPEYQSLVHPDEINRVLGKP